MIKVLQVLSGLNRGGLETFVMNVYRSIDREKVQFDFLTNTANGDYSEEIVSLGGSIYYIPSRNKGIVRFCKNLNSFFNEHRGEYDAIHYHESSLTSLEVLFFAKKAGIPVRIIHSHSSSIMGNKLHYLTHYFGKLFVSNLANRYFGCSDKALDWMFKHTGVRRTAILIRNGIDTSKFKYDEEIRNQIRKELNVNDNDKIIGHVGRFARVKNHKFLIEIFNEFVRKYPSSKLLLIGAGEIEGEIKDLVNSLNLSDSVYFLGIREDTNRFYQAMDIFVMPSFYEGLPVVLVEAQTSGLPVLCSSNISKMSCLTENYYTLSISDTTTCWATKIDEILHTSYRSDGSKKISLKGFDIHTISDYLYHIYAGI